MMLNESEADWFHLDVMDGRFVPNISYGPMIIEFIRSTTKKPCDVHLMIVEPEKYVEDFKAAGADLISVHIEACPHLHRNIQQIKSLGMKAGVAVNPHTPVSSLVDILQDIDFVIPAGICGKGSRDQRSRLRQHRNVFHRTLAPGNCFRNAIQLNRRIGCHLLAWQQPL